jgi:hypothetical protein
MPARNTPWDWPAPTASLAQPSGVRLSRTERIITGARPELGGTYYFGFDDPAATIQTVFSNMRGMALFNGSIYCVAAVANSDGVLKLDGMPHTAAGSNPTVLIDETAGASTGSSDCEVSPDGNLITSLTIATLPMAGFNGMNSSTQSGPGSIR